MEHSNDELDNQLALRDIFPSVLIKRWTQPVGALYNLIYRLIIFSTMLHLLKSL